MGSILMEWIHGWPGKHCSTVGVESHNAGYHRVTAVQDCSSKHPAQNQGFTQEYFALYGAALRKSKVDECWAEVGILCPTNAQQYNSIIVVGNCRSPENCQDESV